MKDKAGIYFSCNHNDVGVHKFSVLMKQEYVFHMLMTVQEYLLFMMK